MTARLPSAQLQVRCVGLSIEPGEPNTADLHLLSSRGTVIGSVSLRSFSEESLEKLRQLMASVENDYARAYADERPAEASVESDGLATAFTSIPNHDDRIYDPES